MKDERDRRQYKREYYIKNADKLKKQISKSRRTLKGRFIALRGTAKQRQICFNLTILDYENIVINKSCNYCRKSLPEAGSGLDRIDSTLGYTKDNVVPCCTRCNKVLGDMTKPEAFAHIQKMLSEYKKSCILASE